MYVSETAFGECPAGTRVSRRRGTAAASVTRSRGNRSLYGRGYWLGTDDERRYFFIQSAGKRPTTKGRDVGTNERAERVGQRTHP